MTRNVLTAKGYNLEIEVWGITFFCIMKSVPKDNIF